MRSGLKVLVAGFCLALVLGAIVVGTSAAQSAAPGAPTGFGGNVVARAAAILGVPEVRLTDALVQAHGEALDDAVKAGYLTQAQADWMKQHQQWMLRNGGPGMMNGFGGPGRGMMGGHFGGYGAGRQAAAATSAR